MCCWWPQYERCAEEGEREEEEPRQRQCYKKKSKRQGNLLGGERQYVSQPWGNMSLDTRTSVGGARN